MQDPKHSFIKHTENSVVFK